MKNKEQMRKILRNYGEKFHELKDLNCDFEQKVAKKTADFALKIPPLRIFLEPTNRCNKHCRYCAHDSMVREISTLPLEGFDNILDGLPEGIYITMTGNGEPMLNPHIYEMCRRAVDHGFVVGMITNGSILTEKNSRSLIESGIHRVQISLDAVVKEVFEDSYGDESGPNGFEATIEKVLRFIYLARNEYAESPFITIAAVMTEPVKKIAALNRKFWQALPVDNFYEGPLLTLQSAAGGYKPTDYSEQESWKVCVNPFTSLKINADGTVNACIQDFSSKYVIGNVREQPLKEILNSEPANRLRQALYEKDFEFLNKIGYHCHQCNAWTAEAKHDIEGYLANSYPITYGLMMHEIDRERHYSPQQIEALKRVAAEFSIDKVNQFVKELQ